MFAPVFYKFEEKTSYRKRYIRKTEYASYRNLKKKI